MIRKSSIIILLGLISVAFCSVSQRMMSVKPGERLEMEFYGNITIFTIMVYNAKDVLQTHVFRVCNGKNKSKCGFWENKKNKQKVGPATIFNIKKSLLIIPKVGDRLEIEYYSPKKLERFVKNAKGVEQHQVYRICNGNNKAKCGFWENIKTKKKVGPTTNYNKKKNMMVIPKVKLLDAGTYRDNYYDTVYVYIEK
ncbi:Protein CBG05388 [Caenorhabditis briggsae]|uniref:Protein CBG05388 n=2 Tax=Caenorhabditis briggsae TaxID=6238 RepID=A8WZR5_CAEBR|nr:Protein CBG05388 [Caenorhabditis briggsae]ULT94790.1 hypothetical protein L3Y34_003913 [Caenorhabditis briggsae]CAP25875.2 Protein CBG05388 [Caenorhabditis briggsae]